MSRTRKYTYGLIAILLAGLAFYSYAQYRESIQRREAEQLARPRNVYLITASGLRADHLSSYLYQPIQTPAIDFLAYDGIRFSNAFSPSSDSLTAHLSALTGIYSFHQPLKDTLEFLYGFQAKTPSNHLPSLPGALRKEGYRTAAFLSDPDLRLPSFFLQLFDQVYCGNKPRFEWESSYSVAAATQLATNWILKGRNKPHFLWLNFDEPKRPFQPPAPYDRHYAKHPYDGEIAAVDEQLAIFMNLLKKQGLFSQSIVILTSPYGESIEPANTHLSSLKESNLRIPLLFAAPGILPVHQYYSAQVNLIDIFPTVMSLLQKPIVPHLDGQPVFKLGTSEEIKHDYLFAETLLPRMFGLPEQYAIRSKGGSSWIIKPEEKLQNSEVERVVNSAGIPLSAKEPQQRFEHDPGALLKNVFDLANQKQPALALDLLQSAIENGTPSAYLLELSGQLAEAAENPSAALTYYSEAQKRDPSMDHADRIARMYLKLNRPNDAEKVLEAYSTEMSSYFNLSTRGLIFFQKGKYNEAIEAFNQTLKENPDYAEAYIYRGNAYALMGKSGNAIADSKRAITLDPEPDDYSTMILLAKLQYVAGNAAQAQKLLAEVITKGDVVSKQEAKKVLASH